MKNIFFLYLFGAVGLLLVTAHTYEYVMDDALITLRYSENFASHGMPICNRAEVVEPTMGYTSPVWMIVNSITAFLTDDKDALVFFTKVYSFLAMLLFLVFVSRWVIDRGYKLGEGLFLIFLLFWNPVIGLHINSGMETILFGVLVFAFAYMILSKKNYFMALAVGFLCYLTRPEAGVIVFIFWFLEFLQNRKLKRSAVAAAMLGALLLGYHLAVWRFYGDVFPAPFYSKQATGSLLKIAALKDSIVFLVFSALPFLIVSVTGRRPDWSKLRIVFLFQAVLFSFYLTVKPMMNVAYRYQMPVLFLLYLTTLVAYLRFARTKEPKNQRTRVLVYSLVGFLWIFNLGVTDMYAKKLGTAARNLRQIGLVLKQKNDHKSWMAYGDAGFVCFYSGFNTIDLVGLNSKQIAKGLLSEEDALRKPEVRIVLKNAEFSADEAIVSRFDLEPFGLLYVGSVPMTRDSRKTMVVQFYTRDGFLTSEDLAGIETAPDYDKSWFESAYYLGRKIIKRR